MVKLTMRGHHMDPPCYFRELRQPDLLVRSYKTRWCLLESLMRTDQIDEALETLPNYRKTQSVRTPSATASSSSLKRG